MAAWTNILLAVKNVLETTCSGSLNTKLVAAKDLIVSDNLASSVFDGTYFTRLKSINKVDDTVNGQFFALYQVSIELCHLISAGDSVTSYNKAVSDIEVIIKEMLKQNSWSAYTNIQMIKLNNLEEPKTILKGDIYQITPIVFDVTIVITY